MEDGEISYSTLYGIVSNIAQPLIDELTSYIQTLINIMATIAEAVI